MTHSMLYHSARAATAIASMAVFSALFFELAAGSTLAVVLFCVLLLAGTLWVSGRVRTSIAEVILAVEAEPSPLPAPPRLPAVVERPL